MRETHFLNDFAAVYGEHRDQNVRMTDVQFNELVELKSEEHNAEAEFVVKKETMSRRYRQGNINVASMSVKSPTMRPFEDAVIELLTTISDMNYPLSYTQSLMLDNELVAER